MSAGGRMEPEVGLVFGKWLLVERVGAGGFGKVFVALQVPGLRLKGALKLMLRDGHDAHAGKLLLRKFGDEARALAELSHSSIVRLLDHDEHEGAPYLVMEYVERGRTLKAEITRRAQQGGEFEPEEVSRILVQVLNALEAAHEANILHRDIKPENVMLQEEAGEAHRVRVLDFGLAKFLEERVETSLVLGTPMYTAPEQMGRQGVGPWTDLYAVGAIAFELLTGRRPFAGRTTRDVLVKKMDPAYDPTCRLADLDVPSFVLAFLRKALAWDPTMRYRSASEMRQALRDVLAGLSRTQPLVSGDLSGLLDSSEVDRLREERELLQAERLAYEEARQRLESERARLRAVPTERELSTRPVTGSGGVQPVARQQPNGQPRSSARWQWVSAVGLVVSGILVGWLASSSPGGHGDSEPNGATPDLGRTGVVTPEEGLGASMSSPASIARPVAEARRIPERVLPVARPAASTAPAAVGGASPGGFIRIEPGEFKMGSAVDSAGRGLDEELHSVRLTRPYLLKATEVTQGEWVSVMGSNPSEFSRCGNDCPVERVSWLEAIVFCNALSRRDRLPECYSGSTFKGVTCTGYRLPTEAEWEFAALSGQAKKTEGGLAAVAVYDGNSGGRTSPVARKSPDGLGLYDMLGNVWEWCNDRYGPYANGSVTDPAGPTTGTMRTTRGGAWTDASEFVRPANRFKSDPLGRYNNVGLRPARTAPGP